MRSTPHEEEALTEPVAPPPWNGPKAKPGQFVGFLSWMFGIGPIDDVDVPGDVVPPLRVSYPRSVSYNFDLLEELTMLGTGAFGTVSLVKHRQTQQVFALKAISKSAIEQSHLERLLRIEKAVMQAMTSSSFLVKLLACFNRGEYVYYLLEAALGGELYYVYKRLKFYGSLVHARFYAACAAEALSHLHQRNIIYRDLKMENMVIDLLGYAKLCDFGSCSFQLVPPRSVCGTAEYMPPEIIEAREQGKGVDWWSLGVLIFELMTSSTPFGAENQMDIFRKALAGIQNVKALEDVAPGSWGGLVKVLCKEDPNERLPMKSGGVINFKEHKWYADAGFQWTELENRTMVAPFKPIWHGPNDFANFSNVELVMSYPEQWSGYDDTGTFEEFEDVWGPPVGLFPEG
eukprot:CAMPEP_0180705428 /NCGR_PEP_ID=MMETSP1038_2-20121128/7673_1 /TAXON_ID=632150 /ORGANISM="Azadinium spinosum, Strain 3D9" /LENGTH=401 /DNA_ID=CAMNT_0022737305 /DNA_START=54 /DNA_END=1255 /DNA_ORIENTATION=+